MSAEVPKDDLIYIAGMMPGYGGPNVPKICKACDNLSRDGICGKKINQQEVSDRYNAALPSTDATAICESFETSIELL